MPLLHLTNEIFDKEVLKSKTAVIVDFWAAWCPPCRMLAPVFEELSNEKEYAGKLKFGKLDTEEAPEIASRYGIMSIPSLLIFADGKVRGMIVGAVPKDELKKRIGEILRAQGSQKP